jgi:sugar lactone lactonase YvrE
VVPNGRVYFSDASTKFAAADADGTLSASLLDIMEHGLYGRIIEYDPTSGDTQVVMTDLSFANGVAAAANGEFLLVAETGGYRIWKHWLAGDKSGQSEVLVDNLPGFPDNVHIGHDGRFWVGLTTKRTAILDDLSDKPFWRKVVQRMPEFMRPKVVAYGHVLAINGEGEVLQSLQDPNGKYPATTGAWETAKHLYVSSLTAPVLARFNKSKLGVE